MIHCRDRSRVIIFGSFYFEACLNPPEAQELAVVNAMLDLHSNTVDEGSVARAALAHDNFASIHEQFAVLGGDRLVHHDDVILRVSPQRECAILQFAGLVRELRADEDQSWHVDGKSGRQVARQPDAVRARNGWESDLMSFAIRD